MEITTFFQSFSDKVAAAVSNGGGEDFHKSVHLIASTAKAQKKVILVGNGGSAAIASHVTVDLANAAGVRALNFNEPALISCLANDFGYENWVVRALKMHADPGDLLILISSSGQSMNIVNAANYARSADLRIITFSGFDHGNPLKTKGDVNHWVDSTDYNIVELAHLAWLLAMVDGFKQHGGELT